jgi:hypothetical protein
MPDKSLRRSGGIPGQHMPADIPRANLQPCRDSKVMSFSLSYDIELSFLPMNRPRPVPSATLLSSFVACRPSTVTFMQAESVQVVLATLRAEQYSLSRAIGPPPRKPTNRALLSSQIVNEDSSLQVRGMGPAIFVVAGHSQKTCPELVRSGIPLRRRPAAAGHSAAGCVTSLRSLSLGRGTTGSQGGDGAEPRRQWQREASRPYPPGLPGRCR